MKTIDVFYQEIAESDALQTEMIDAATKGCIEEFFASHGCQMAEEEIWSYFRKQLSCGGELSDRELESILGGAGTPADNIQMLLTWRSYLAGK